MTARARTRTRTRTRARGRGRVMKLRRLRRTWQLSYAALAGSMGRSCACRIEMDLGVSYTLTVMYRGYVWVRENVGGEEGD